MVNENQSNLYKKLYELESRLNELNQEKHAKMIIANIYKIRNIQLNPKTDFFYHLEIKDNNIIVWYDIEFLTKQNQYKRVRFEVDGLKVAKMFKKASN